MGSDFDFSRRRLFTRSSAGPGAAASGHCACLADGADPRRRRASFRPRSGTPSHRLSRGGPIGQIHFGVRFDLLIRCPPRSLRSIRDTLVGRACRPGPAWASIRARPSHPSHSVGPAPGPRLGPDRVMVRDIRVAGLYGESGGAWPAAPNASGATPRLAGRSITVGGWMGAKVNPLSNGNNPRLCRSVRLSPK